VIRAAVIVSVGALVAACFGCGGQTMDQWLKEKLVPPPTASHVARIESARPDERREALEAVARDPAARQTPSVVRLFCLIAKTDKDPMVRSAAVRGLAEMQGEEVWSALDTVARRDQNPFVRADAVTALGRQALLQSLGTLKEVLTGDADSDVRMAAAETLRQFKHKAAVQMLAAALGDASLGVSLKAWESLRYMTGRDLPRDVGPWQEFLASAADPFVAYGKAPPMPRLQNQRPQFTKGPIESFKGLFAKDVREAELQ
jgi:hypothetical protein